MAASTRSRCGGFTLVELLLVIAIIALLITILIPSLGAARGAARVAICENNMSQLAIAEAGYGVDGKDRIGALNWIPGKGSGADPDLVSLTSDDWMLNQGKQACDILRRMTGRHLPLVQNRSFNRNFWHLVLSDGGYFGAENNAIVPGASCPDDAWVKLWQANPDNYSALVGSVGPDPTAAPTGAYEWYRPYWCSYQLVPAAWAPDRNRGGYLTLRQDPDYHHLFLVPGSALTTPMGQRRYDEVSFAGQKVIFFDLFDRHTHARSPIWYAYPAARAPLAFFDGSVRYLRTGDALRGWTADTPDSPAPSVYRYDPATGFPGYDFPTLSGNPTDTVVGYYRWTREGLRGVDYPSDGKR